MEADVLEESCRRCLEALLGPNTLAVVREGTARLLHRDACDVALALCNNLVQVMV